MKSFEKVEALVKAPALIAQGMYASYVHHALSKFIYQIPEGQIYLRSCLGIAHKETQSPDRQLITVEKLGILTSKHIAVEVIKGEYGHIDRIDATQTLSRINEAGEGNIVCVDTFTMQGYDISADGLTALSLIKSLKEVHTSASREAVRT